MPKIYPPKRKPFRRVYTKTGDQGQCSIGSGKRVFKNDPVVEALGAVDELNALLGVIKSKKSKVKTKIYKVKVKSYEYLSDIQKDLFIAGAMLSGAPGGSKKNLLKTRVKFLEDQIDKLSQDLPELKNFILPGGCQTASFLHLARTVCRRAERRVVRINVNMPNRRANVPPTLKLRRASKDIIIYLNRLSDFLFALARFTNYQTGTEEIKWTAKF